MGADKAEALGGRFCFEVHGRVVGRRVGELGLVARATAGEASALVDARNTEDAQSLGVVDEF
jgi:hypothetical protein